MLKSLPPLLADHRLRVIIGGGCILFGLLNGVLYYRELALAAQSKSDIRELNKRTTQRVTPSPVLTPTPAPTPTVVVSESPTPSPAAPKPAAAPTVKATPVVTVPVAETSGKVKISTATEAQFDTLPGIGPSKAKAIVEYRASKPFTKLEDLKEVPGIGDKTYENLLPHIEL